MSRPRRAGLRPILRSSARNGPPYRHPRGKNPPVRSYLIMVVAILAFCAVFGGLYMGVQMYIFRGSSGSNALAEIMDKVIRYGFAALIFGGVAGWYWWSQRSGRGQFF